MRKLSITIAICLLAIGGFAANAQQLRIALNAEPDILDPDLSQTITGRDVLGAMCDSLFDLSPDLEILPRLASDWKWADDGLSLEIELRQGITFHDGAVFDANAVKSNLERSINLPGSFRAKDLEHVEKIGVEGSHKLRIFLREYDNALIYKLSDTTGMMISPTAARVGAEGEIGDIHETEFSKKPVCAGAFRFKSASADRHRVALEKYTGYWNTTAIHFDGAEFLTVPNAQQRLEKLNNGELDIILEPRAEDIAIIQADTSLRMLTKPSFSFQFFFINLSKGLPSQNPMGQSELIRWAFNTVIDRKRLNEIMFAGLAEPGNQPFPPHSPWYNALNPIPATDVAKAREMVVAAGYDRISIDVLVEDNLEKRQLFNLIQEMTAEIGIDLVPQFKSFDDILGHLDTGNFQMVLLNWVGRMYPEYNVNLMVTCDGPYNYSYYCNSEVDQFLFTAQSQLSPRARMAYHDAAGELLARDLPLVYLYHPAWNWVMPSLLSGFVTRFDGAIRYEDLRFVTSVK